MGKQLAGQSGPLRRRAGRGARPVPLGVMVNGGHFRRGGPRYILDGMRPLAPIDNLFPRYTKMPAKDNHQGEGTFDAMAREWARKRSR